MIFIHSRQYKRSACISIEIHLRVKYMRAAVMHTQKTSHKWYAFDRASYNHAEGKKIAWLMERANSGQMHNGYGSHCDMHFAFTYAIQDPFGPVSFQPFAVSWLLFFFFFVLYLGYSFSLASILNTKHNTTHLHALAHMHIYRYTYVSSYAIRFTAQSKCVRSVSLVFASLCTYFSSLCRTLPVQRTAAHTKHD